MHPTLRQVPPSRPDSTSTTSRPSSAARGGGGVAAGTTADHQHVDGAGDLAGDHQAPSSEQRQRGLEAAPHGEAEVDDVPAVDDAVVGGEVHHEHPSGDDPVVVVELRSAPRRAEPGDADLAPVHERGAEPPAEHPVVGDGERAAGEFGRGQPAGASGLAEPGQLARQLEQRALVGVADDREHEAVGRVDGDADVAPTVEHDLAGVGVEAGVEQGMLDERQRGRPEEERRDRHGHAALGGDRLELLANGEQVGDVDLVERVDVGDRPPGRRHRLGGALAHAAQGDPRIDAGRRPVHRRCRRRHGCRTRAAGSPAGAAAARVTSSSVIRPLGPVPPTTPRSTPSRRARARVAGVARGRSPATVARDGCAGGARGRGGVRRRGSGRRRGRRRGVAVFVDRDQQLADGDDLAGFPAERHHDAGGRRRHLHHRLVGLDLDDGLVLDDVVADGDEPRDDLGLGQALADVDESELHRHRAHHP